MKHKDYFKAHDRNDEECLLAAAFSGQVKAEMERLSVKLTELSAVESIPTGSWFKKMKKWMV